jgi:hypothetical protein
MFGRGGDALKYDFAVVPISIGEPSCAAAAGLARAATGV